jgi:hypothetical protein
MASNRTATAKNRTAPASNRTVKCVLAGLGLLAGFIALHGVAAGDGIYVPAPRGENDTIDTRPAGAGGAGGGGLDSVATRAGDVVAGRVLEIADGKVRLAGPQFDGEVKVKLPGVKEINFAPPEPMAARDAVAVSNEDLIMGEVTGITADVVTIDSDCAGTLKLSRKMVTSIGFGKAAGVMIHTDFTRGLAPWKVTTGSAVARDGALCIESTNGNYNTISAAVDQSKAVTVEMTIVGAGQYTPYFALALCADANTGGNTFGQSNLLVYNNGSSYNITGQNNGGNFSVINNRQVKPIPTNGSATVRIAYDPHAKKLKYWMDNVLVGEHDVGGSAPAAGKYIHLGFQYPCKVKNLRVSAGFSGPTDKGGKENESDMVYFANKDAVTATSLGLAEGTLTIKTEIGELKSGPDKIDRVVFRAGEKPRLQKGDVLVTTRNGQYTVKLESLTGETLNGVSDYLGKVKIKRSAIRSIRFGLYDDAR